MILWFNKYQIKPFWSSKIKSVLKSTFLEWYEQEILLFDMLTSLERYRRYALRSTNRLAISKKSLSEHLKYSSYFNILFRVSVTQVNAFLKSVLSRLTSSSEEHRAETNSIY